MHLAGKKPLRQHFNPAEINQQGEEFWRWIITLALLQPRCEEAQGPAPLRPICIGTSPEITAHSLQLQGHFSGWGSQIYCICSWCGAAALSCGCSSPCSALRPVHGYPSAEPPWHLTGEKFPCLQKENFITSVKGAPHSQINFIGSIWSTNPFKTSDIHFSVMMPAAVRTKFRPISQDYIIIGGNTV